MQNVREIIRRKASLIWRYAGSRVS